LLRILTLNTALQNIRLLGRNIYEPVPWTRERLTALPGAIRSFDPDIICLQECFHPIMQRHLQLALAKDYPYAAGLSRSRPRLRLAADLLTFSRLPLTGYRLHFFSDVTLEERLFARLGFHCNKVRLPDGNELDIVNVHASAGGMNRHPEDPAMEHLRSRQIAQLLTSVDPDRPTLIIGDLNAGPHTSIDNYQQLTHTGWIDAFDTGGGDGITWDPDNPLVQLGEESFLPPQRIDHVLYNKAASNCIQISDANIILHDRRLTLHGRRIPVSDHYGLLTTFTID
jgi:endonuclease/exonuclease/phosphatase family metal-dependent hydrolase